MQSDFKKHFDQDKLRRSCFYFLGPQSCLSKINPILRNDKTRFVATSSKVSLKNLRKLRIGNYHMTKRKPCLYFESGGQCCCCCFSTFLLSLTSTTRFTDNEKHIYRPLSNCDPFKSSKSNSFDRALHRPIVTHKPTMTC